MVCKFTCVFLWAKEESNCHNNNDNNVKKKMKNLNENKQHSYLNTMRLLFTLSFLFEVFVCTPSLSSASSSEYCKTIEEAVSQSSYSHRTSNHGPPQKTEIAAAAADGMAHPSYPIPFQGKQFCSSYLFISLFSFLHTQNFLLLYEF